MQPPLEPSNLDVHKGDPRRPRYYCVAADIGLLRSDPAPQEAEQLGLRVGTLGRVDLGVENTGLTNHRVQRQETRVRRFGYGLVESLISSDCTCQIPGVHQDVVTHQPANQLLGGHWAKRARQTRAEIASGDAGEKLCACCIPRNSDVGVGSDIDWLGTREEAADATEVVGDVHNDITSCPLATW